MTRRHRGRANWAPRTRPEAIGAAARWGLGTAPPGRQQPASRQLLSPELASERACGRQERVLSARWLRENRALRESAGNFPCSRRNDATPHDARSGHTNTIVISPGRSSLSQTSLDSKGIRSSPGVAASPRVHTSWSTRRNSSTSSPASRCCERSESIESNSVGRRVPPVVMDGALRALVVGGVAWNTMVYLDEFPAARPGTVFARGSREASSGARHR